MHIHDGSVKEGRAPRKRSSRTSTRSSTSDDSKPKRKVSKYQKDVGRHMKALKKRKYRGNVMKEAHRLAKKDKKKSSTKKGQVRKTARRAYER